MAQATYTPILLYHSTTAAAVPLAANLAAGELAINIVDGKLYYENNSGVVTLLASAAGSLGDVVGPASATDNALARFDLTTGKLIQNSVGILSDAGILTGLTGITSSGSITFSSLTSGRVTFAGASGLLTDSANLTWNGTSLSATQIDITAQGTLRLQDTTGGEYVALRAPASLAGNYTLTFPADDGTSGQALITDGSGVLSWSTAASGDVYGPASSTANGIALFDGTTGKLIKDSAATDGLIYGITVGRGAGAVSSNTAVGASALAANTTGAQNTAFGAEALKTNTSGGPNTALGYRALYLNTTAINNTAVGYAGLLVNTTGADNTTVGHNSLASNTTGSQNTAVGTSALVANTTASYNTAVGYQAGYSITTGANNQVFGPSSMDQSAGVTGSENVVVGRTSMRPLTSGSYNVSVGNFALNALTTGSNNTAIGYLALPYNTTASNNTAVGYLSMFTNTTGPENTAVGRESLKLNTTGYYNAAFGHQSLFSNTTGGENSAFGMVSLNSNTTGNYNTAFGSRALQNTTTGQYNTAVGYNAALLNTTGSFITAIGVNAGRSTTTGFAFTAVGYECLYANTTGVQNTAVGGYCNFTGVSGALRYNTSGSRNTAMGNGAAQTNTTGGDLAAFGVQSLYNNTTGGQNTAVGNYALLSNTTATGNTAVGYQAGNSNTTGPSGTFVGYQAGYSATTGNSHTLVGYQAGYGITTGTDNVFIGNQAGYNTTATTTGSANVYIGSVARGSAVGNNREIVLGFNVSGQGTNTVTLGSDAGKIYNSFSVNATWTQTSDERLKTNVQYDSLGLSFINRLRPVKFNWKPSNEIDQNLSYYNETNQRDTETVIHGLIAQEVKTALDAEGVTTFAGWDEGPDGIQAISREMFITPLINAVNELTAQVKQLKAELATLKGN